jgi:hypothetical protein
LSGVYFWHQYPLGRITNMRKIDISLDLSYDNNKIYLKYFIDGFANYGHGRSIPLYRSEIRNVINGELLDTVAYDIIYSKEKLFYLLNKTKLYDMEGALLYDITKIFDNQIDLINFEIASAQISPNNKFIVLTNDSTSRYIIVDFKSGKILRVIKGYIGSVYNISYDDNFLFTSTTESTVSVNNLNYSSDAFDKILFFRGGNPGMHISCAEFSNTIAFTGSDRALRLWKPNLTLTTVEDDKIHPEVEDCIYPNPVTDIISFSDKTEIYKSISIYSVLGNKIIELTPNGYEINVGFLSPGIYFLKSGNKYCKFIKI